MALLFLAPDARFDPSHLFFVVSALLWAASIALVKRNSSHIGPVVVTAVQLSVSGLVILTASLLLEEMPARLPSPDVWGWFFASVLISTCLRFLLQFRGQQMISAGRAAVLMCCEPVWALIFSVSFLGTAVSLSQAAGCAVIFAAMLYQVISPTQKAAR